MLLFNRVLYQSNFVYDITGLSGPEASTKPGMLMPFLTHLLLHSLMLSLYLNDHIDNN